MLRKRTTMKKLENFGGVSIERRNQRRLKRGRGVK